MVDRDGRKPGGESIARCVLAAMAALAVAVPAWSQGADRSVELAKKLANPAASLISVPLQYNHDGNYGPEDEGSKSVLNIQPVLPFSVSERWNLILRTIAPVVDEQGVPQGTDESGLGDIMQSFFFSPKKSVRGWIVAAGPVLLYSTATNEVLGYEKWGAGPTALALKQSRGWTTGLLTNHVVSFAGEDSRADIATTLLQPFVSYVTKTRSTIGFSSEATYDWKAEQWTVPVVVSGAQMLKVGPQIIQVSAGPRFWLEAPDHGPEGVGVRVTLTLLFPR